MVDTDRRRVRRFAQALETTMYSAAQDPVWRSEMRRELLAQGYDEMVVDAALDDLEAGNVRVTLRQDRPHSTNDREDD